MLGPLGHVGRGGDRKPTGVYSGPVTYNVAMSAAHPHLIFFCHHHQARRSDDCNAFSYETGFHPRQTFQQTTPVLAIFLGPLASCCDSWMSEGWELPFFLLFCRTDHDADIVALWFRLAGTVGSSPGKCFT